MKQAHKSLLRTPVAAAIALSLCGITSNAYAVCTPLNLTVTTTVDNIDHSDNALSLREALNETIAIPSCAEPHVITFDESLNGQSIELGSSLWVKSDNNFALRAPEGTTVTLAPKDTFTNSNLFNLSPDPHALTPPTIHAHFENIIFDGKSIPREAPLVYANKINTVTFKNIEARNYDRTEDINLTTSGALTLNYVTNPITIDQGTFTNNKSTIGSSVTMTNVTATLINVSFHDNQALSQDAGSQDIKSRGGAIYYTGNTTASLTIENAEFVNNHSFPIDNSGKPAHGGAISTIGTGYGLTIRDAIFDNNTASTPGLAFGGHVSIVGTSISALIENASFTNGNSSGAGGAIYIKDGSSNCNLNIINSSIAYNKATLRGGGIAKGADGSVLLSNCNINLIQSTLSGNSALYGGAIYHSTDSGATNLKQSTVTNNGTRLRGSAFYSEVTSDALECDHSVIADNLTYHKEITSGLSDGMLVNESYCFVGTGADLKPISNGAHTPQWYSLLVDAADPTYTPHQDTDQLGNPRIEGNGMDIGAVESFNQAPEISNAIVDIEIGPIVNGPFDLIQMAGITDDNDYIVFETNLGNLHPSITVNSSGALTVDASTDRSLLDTIPKDGYISFELSFGDTVNPDLTVTIHAYMKDMPPEMTTSVVDFEIAPAFNGPYDLVDLAGITDDNNVIIFDTTLTGLHNTISLTANGLLSIDASLDTTVHDNIPEGGSYNFTASFSDGVNPAQELTIQLYEKDLPLEVTSSSVDIEIGAKKNGPFNLYQLAGVSDDNNIAIFDTNLINAHSSISVTSSGALYIDTSSDQSLLNLIPEGGSYSFNVDVSDGVNSGQTITVNVSKNSPIIANSTVDIEIGIGMNGPFYLATLAEMKDDHNQIAFDTDLGNLHNTISLSAQGVLSIDTAIDQTVLFNIPNGLSYNFNVSYSDGFNPSQTLTVRVFKSTSQEILNGGNQQPEQEQPDNNTPPPPSPSPTPKGDSETSNSGSGAGGGGGSNGLITLLALGLVFTRRFLGKNRISM